MPDPAVRGVCTRPLTPRAAAPARPLQHLQVPAPSGRRARLLVPRMVLLPRPPQHIQVPDRQGLAAIARRVIQCQRRGSKLRWLTWRGISVGPYRLLQRICTLSCSTGTRAPAPTATPVHNNNSIASIDDYRIHLHRNDLWRTRRRWEVQLIRPENGFDNCFGWQNHRIFGRALLRASRISFHAFFCTSRGDVFDRCPPSG